MKLGIALLVLLLPGCSGDTQEEVAEPAPPPAALRASEKILGTWTLVMGDAERRRQEVLKVAIQEPPPTPEEIDALEMNADEQMQFKFTQMAMLQNPDPEMVAEMRIMITEMHKATMTITADQMIMDIGGVKDVSSYAVVNQNQSGATVQSKREGEPEEMYDLSFPAPDQLKLANVEIPEDVMILQRKPR